MIATYRFCSLVFWQSRPLDCLYAWLPPWRFFVRSKKRLVWQCIPIFRPQLTVLASLLVMLALLVLWPSSVSAQSIEPTQN